MTAVKHGNRWTGGRKQNHGYIQLLVPGHPRASRGYVHEHIVIVERALGYFLVPPHQVHHRDRDRSDNSNSNLIVCEDQAYHRLLHLREEVYRATGDARKRRCARCRLWDDPANMVIHSGEGASSRFTHRLCHARYERDRRLR